jgi:DNA polymerase III epsilon subunit-like protein
MLYIYLDFEATGLSVWHDHITQIGAVASRQNQTNHIVDIISNFDTYVFTDKRISDRASEKTGITNEHLKDAPRTKSALTNFFEWIISLKLDEEDVVLAAYNGINYDFPLMCSEMHRWEINIPRQFKACGISYLLDPLKYARSNVDDQMLLRTKTGKCSFCLGDVYLALIGCNFENSHTALADTIALHKVCTHDAFKTMAIEDNSTYCLHTNQYITTFMDKRQSVDSSLKKNTKKKLMSLFDMKSNNNKRQIDDDHNECNVKKRRLVEHQYIENKIESSDQPCQQQHSDRQTVHLDKNQQSDQDIKEGEHNGQEKYGQEQQHNAHEKYVQEHQHIAQEKDPQDLQERQHTAQEKYLQKQQHTFEERDLQELQHAAQQQNLKEQQHTAQEIDLQGQQHTLHDKDLKEQHTADIQEQDITKS